MTRRLVAFTLLAAAGSSACTLGPNYKRPTITPPPVYRSVTVTPEQAHSIADQYPHEVSSCTAWRMRNHLAGAIDLYPILRIRERLPYDAFDRDRISHITPPAP